jgi:hypothetical protein
MLRPRTSRPKEDRRRFGAARRGSIGRGATLIVGALVTALLLSSCLSAGYTYVNHRNPDGTNLYFKVPAAWTLYDAKQVLESQNGPLGPAQLKQLTTGQWIEAFDASPTPSVANALGLGARYPTGIADAEQLSTDARDSLSFAAMRAALLGTDPLTATSGFQILNYNEFTGAGGVRGIKLVTNITDKTPVHTFGQVVAVDAQTNWLYAIGISCSISCWGSYSSLIDQTLNSWSVKEAKT